MERSVGGRPWLVIRLRAVTSPSMCRMLVVRADHSRNVCACWRAEFLRRSTHALAPRQRCGHSAPRPGQAAFHTDSDGKPIQVQSSNLLLPARFGLPPAACSFSGPPSATVRRLVLCARHSSRISCFQRFVVKVTRAIHFLLRTLRGDDWKHSSWVDWDCDPRRVPTLGPLLDGRRRSDR